MPSHADVERAIRSVPGVAEATVARAEDTGRGRLRIRLQPGEDQERVSWSVAATLRERFDIALDPDEIRPRPTPLPDDEEDHSRPPSDDVATPESGPAPSSSSVVQDQVILLDTGEDTARTDPATPPSPVPGESSPPGSRDDTAVRPWRPAIRDLGSRNDGVSLTVTATLGLENRVATGEASGTPTTRGLHRAIAEATLLALGQLTSGPLRAQVDRVTVGEADPAAATVVVSLLSERGEELLLGASIVRGDVEHAVMRAALDALNRRVERDLAIDG